MDKRFDLRDYDFIDVGASSGGAIEYAQRKLGWGKGIGIDLDNKKVEAAKQAGRHVVQGDATKLDLVFRGKCDFAIASHFLEHLPTLEVAESCLESLGCHVNKGIFVQQPTFDFKDELASLGVKLYWSHWSGHPNMMSIAMWQRVINSLVMEKRIFSGAVLGVAKPIVNTSDDSLIPLGSPINSLAYDPSIHLPKRGIDIKFDLYREVKVVFYKGGCENMLDQWCSRFGLLKINGLDRD